MLRSPLAGCAFAVALLGCATAPEFDPEPRDAGDRAFGAVGVVVDDSTGSGQAPQAVAQELQRTGRFSSVTLHDFGARRQIRVEVRKRIRGSEEAATAKLLAGAATLFLVPMAQSYEYAVHFVVECRGKSVVEWRFWEPAEEAQWVFLGPHRSVPGPIRRAVQQFVQEESVSAAFAKPCE